MEGKVFYNKEGRQVGSYIPSPVYVKSMVLQPATGEYSEIPSLRYIMYSFNNGEYGNGKFQFQIDSEDFNRSVEYNGYIEGINAVIGIQINDEEIYHFTSPNLDTHDLEIDNYPYSTNALTIYGDGAYDKCWFFHNMEEKRIYLGHLPEDKQVTVYYI